MKTNKTTRRVYTDLYGSQPIAGIRAAERMARGAGMEAERTAGQYGTEATDIGSMLTPALEKEALSPQGYSQADLSAMSTAAQGATGGTTSSIAGEAANQAARTRNVAGTSAILDEAARERMRTNSQNALGIQASNARLRESNRQAGLRGLGQLRGEDIRADLEAQGLVPQDIKAWTDASKSGWLQNTLGVIDSLTGAGKTAASLGLHI